MFALFARGGAAGRIHGAQERHDSDNLDESEGCGGAAERPALKGTKATGSSIELQTSGATGNLTKTDGDTYDRDGSVHELTINITGGDTLTSSRYVQFGGGWSDIYWNGEVTFYELQFIDENDSQVAALVPCREIATDKVGFYDTVAGAFRTKLLDSWLDFIPGEVEQQVGEIVVNGSPSDLGTVSPAYGMSAVTPGAATQFYVEDRQYDDGKWCVIAGEGRRASLKNCEISTNGASALVSENSLFVYTIPETYDSLFAVWSFTNVQWRTVGLAGAGGTVAVAGAEGTVVTNWTAEGATVALSATPDATHSFVAWTGDVEGVDVSSASIVVPATSARTLTATFKEKPQRDPIVSTWTGASGGDWNDSGNWDRGVPDDGDTAVLTSDAALTVIVSASTAELGKLVISNAADAATTLISSNWFTKIRATDLVVGKGGVITCGGPFLDTEMSNRVDIAAATVSVEEGGSITTSGKGYLGLNGPAWKGFDFSTWGDKYKILGGSYGGQQGVPAIHWEVSGYNNPYPQPVTYGSASLPTDPGSGGGQTDAAYAAGGAIRIIATGAVRIDGTVSSDGLMPGGSCGGGSGGSVLISCATVSGAGSVSANGGQPSSNAGTAGAGGGGRVAVLYDIWSQAEVEDCTVGFEARGGVGFFSNFRGSGYKGAQFVSEHGTLYFPDNRFLTDATYRAAGLPFAGVWSSPTEVTGLTFTGDALFDGTGLSFSHSGFTIDVAGNMSVTGRKCRVSGLILNKPTIVVGGDLSIASATLEMKDGGYLAVTGDLTQDSIDSGAYCYSRAGELVVRAAETNNVVASGGSVSVGGDWKMAGKSVTTAYCEKKTGSIVTFTAGSFDLGANARVDVTAKGYEALGGPGVAGSYYGASHGGMGGAQGNKGDYVKNRKPTYDSLEHPCMPGSGGANGENGHCGGGVFHLVCTGTLKLDGVIDANGGPQDGHYFWYQGASGGAVYLKGQELLASSGTIYAKGGQSGSWDPTSGGGGGRLAIWAREGLSNASAMTLDLSGGLPNGTVETNNAEAGTVYLGLTPAPADTFTVESSSERLAGDRLTPTYGDYDVSVGNSILCTAPDGDIAVSESLHIVFNGWILYSCDADGNRTEIDRASTNQFLYVHRAEGDIRELVWQIVKTAKVTITENTAGAGSYTINGKTATTGENWVAECDAVTISATPNEEYTFISWSGGDLVPTAETTITVPYTTTEQTYAATFGSVSHEPVTTAWKIKNDTGYWLDAANWDNGIPQKGDDVVLVSDQYYPTTVLVGSSTPELNSLTVGQSRSTGYDAAYYRLTLKLTGWSTRLHAKSVTVQKGGYVTTEGGIRDGEASNRVWIAGTTLDVQDGGWICADLCGYRFKNGPCWNETTKAYNWDSGNNIYGGAYGGNQPKCGEDRYGDNVGLETPHTYGSAEWPTDLGSGGGPGNTTGGGGRISVRYTHREIDDGEAWNCFTNMVRVDAGPASGGTFNGSDGTIHFGYCAHGFVFMVR